MFRLKTNLPGNNDVLMEATQIYLPVTAVAYWVHHGVVPVDG